MKGRPISTNVRLQVETSGFTAMTELKGQESTIERATVLEIGDEVTLVKVGDRVLFKDYNVDEITVDDETFVICPESDIRYVFDSCP